MTRKHILPKFLILCFIVSIVVNIDLTRANNTQDSLNLNLTPQRYLEITSDDQLKDMAQKNGWKGDGSYDNPIIIENYNFTEIKKNPQIANDIKSSENYLQTDFNEFNLVITNIVSSITLRNNQFTSAVLFNVSNAYSNIDIQRILIIKNKWINPSNPNNLFTIGNNFLISFNTFSGSLNKCENGLTDLPARVYTNGVENMFDRNIFESDYGCFPIQNILMHQPIPRGSGVLLHKTTIRDNLFLSNNLSLNIQTISVIVDNNDFFVKQYAIATNFITSLLITHNNFYISDETNTYSLENGSFPFIIGTYNIPKVTCLPGFSSCGSTTILNSNYYSNWVTPDKDSDGIVDMPYTHQYVQMKDLYPYTKPFSTYYNPIPDKTSYWKPILIISSVLFLFGISYSTLYPKYQKSKAIYSGDLPGNTKSFIKELFQSQTVLYYTLVGQSKIGDKEIEKEVKGVIPHDIMNYKFLFHPVRLSIIKLLYENLELTSMELKDILRISWNDYYTYAYSLGKKGYIKIEDQFVDGNKRQVLSIENKGIEEYKVLIDLMHLFLDNSVDYQAYIEAAQRKMDSIDQDLYPKD